MIFLRIGLFFSLAVIGSLLMGAVGGLFLVPKSAGLAGGAMVLGWALMGAVICGITGLLVTRKFSGRELAGLTAIVTGIAALLIVFVIVRQQQIDAAKKDPEHLYAGIPDFEVSLQQIQIVDPYLSTRIEVESTTRRWATTLPDGRVCSGRTPAATLRQIGESLVELSALTSSDLQVCAQREDDAQQQLNWTLNRNGVKELKILRECLKARPEVAATVRAVSGVSRLNTSKVKCR